MNYEIVLRTVVRTCSFFFMVCSIIFSLNIDYAYSSTATCKSGSGNSAVEACDRAIRKAPTSLLYFYRADHLSDLNRFDEAISDYTKSIELNPHFAKAYVYRGHSYFSKGLYENAIEDYSKAAKITPKDSNIYVHRSTVWMYTGNYDQALTDIEQAITLNKKNASAYYKRAPLWDYTSLPEDVKQRNALADYNRAILLDSKEARHYRGRADFYLGNDQFAEAIIDYTKAIKLDSNYTYALMQRAVCYAALRMFPEAKSDLDKAIQVSAVDSEKGQVYVARSLVYRLIGDRDTALQEINSAFNYFTQEDTKYQSAAFFYRGRLFYELGDYRRAVTDLHKSIDVDPNSTHSQTYYYLANSRAKLNDLVGAIRDFEQAVRLNPNNANAKEALEFALKKQQSNKNADTTTSIDTERSGESGSKSFKKRIALVIGNTKYQAVPPLLNPTQDAELFSKTLRDSGFDEVTTKLDLTRSEMLAALGDFGLHAATADWAVVYFAGHGVEISGVNYLIPVDAKVTAEDQMSTETVNLEFFLNSVQRARGMRLVILDACRNNPFIDKLVSQTSSRGLTKFIDSSVGVGLARIEPEPGTLVVYSAKAGEFALDGEGKNSPFAEALAKRIEQKPPIEVRRLFDFVRKDVFDETGKQQQPFAYGSLEPTEDFYFRIVQ